MPYFNFERLIKKYSRDFVLSYENEGGYDEKGEYVKGETISKELHGAIIRKRENKSIRNDGTQTENSYVLYMIDNPSINIINSIILYDGEMFRVMSKLENSEFTGVYSYELKAVSAFND